jgi:hypothetical protein
MFLERQISAMEIGYWAAMFTMSMNTNGLLSNSNNECSASNNACCTVTFSRW